MSAEAHTISEHELSLEEDIDRLFDALTMRLQRHVEARVAEFDLSSTQAMALQRMGCAAPMRELADHMGCDASYVTGLADGLEKRGLVERQPCPNDRRIKNLAMTEKGVALRKALKDRLLDDSPLLKNLTDDEKVTLHKLLQKSLQ